MIAIDIFCLTPCFGRNHDYISIEGIAHERLSHSARDCLSHLKPVTTDVLARCLNDKAKVGAELPRPFLLADGLANNQFKANPPFRC